MTTHAATIQIRAFLRARAGTCVSREGVRGMLLRLGDVGGLFPDGITAAWMDADGIAFFEKHQADLNPGNCLDLEIYKLRSLNGELRARIKSCALAPPAPSWIKHAEKVQQSNQEQQTA